MPFGRTVGRIYFAVPAKKVPSAPEFKTEGDKATYTLNDQFSFGGSVYWSPSVLNSGADGTFLAGTAKYILPTVLPNGIGWFVSADVGHWFLGTSDAFYGIPIGLPGGVPYKSYTTWDVGVAFTWKQFTL